MIARAQLNVLHVLAVGLVVRLLHESLARGNLGSQPCQECAVWDTDRGCRQARKRGISADNSQVPAKR